jgi:hypothetical protein
MKLKRKLFDPLLVISPNLKTCFTFGLTACIVLIFLFRHLSPLLKQKYCIEFINSGNGLQGILAVAKSIQSAPGLQKMLLHEEGVKVNKSDLGLLATLDNLYAIIAQYDPENVYNMDETGLFFRLPPRYNLLMPNEDISTTRGKKKSKDRVSLIMCANVV